jgi:1,4-dihydroxy-6-naphthoate synthase
MYVNSWTLDYGPTGRRAVATLLGRAADAGLLPRVAEPDFVGGGA